jgi:hypothetical protein
MHGPGAAQARASAIRFSMTQIRWAFLGPVFAQKIVVSASCIFALLSFLEKQAGIGSRPMQL